MFTAYEAKKMSLEAIKKNEQITLEKEARALDTLDGVIMSHARQGTEKFYTSFSQTFSLKSVQRMIGSLEKRGFIIQMTGAYTFSVEW